MKSKRASWVLLAASIATTSALVSGCSSGTLDDPNAPRLTPAGDPVGDAIGAEDGGANVDGGAPTGDTGAPTGDTGAPTGDTAVKDGSSGPEDTAIEDAGAGADAGTDGSGAGTDAGTGAPKPAAAPPLCVWNHAYQENYEADSVAEILAGARGCYVLVDPFQDSLARKSIPQMKKDGNVVGCYVSTGTCESWRDDFTQMKPYCVSKEWGEWAGEYFVDAISPGLVALMKARIDKMAAWGCDMVEYDNMDFTFDSAYRKTYGFTATAADGKAYNRALCDYTRLKGMRCMAKNTTEGAADFDGVTMESYSDEKDWWADSELQGMLDKGGLGVIVHYDEKNCGGVRSAYETKYGKKLSFICEDPAIKGYRHYVP